MGRIVVLGASGMLGRAVVRELAARGLDHAAPPRSELDLAADGLEAGLEACEPSAVINAAAYTDVAGAERSAEHEAVYRLNRDAPAALARACARRGVPLVHVSTDYVFDGRERRPYREDDPTAPLQVYGRSKLEGERLVLATHPAALVARTSTLYGPGRIERPHYVDAVLHRARERGRLELVELPVSSPTYSLDLARGLLDLLAAGARGVVHVANLGGCSRIELAREALRLAGLSPAIVERPDPPAPPRRPAYSVLDLTRFAEITGRAPRSWRAALADYLAT